MNKLLLSAVTICSIAALTSCNKKLGELKSDYFTTTPTPLEASASKVPGTVSGSIPQKYFSKNAELKITPVLVYGSQESTAAPYTVQGEKVQANNQVISYKDGGTVTVPFTFDYTDDMLKSDLYLDFNVTQGKKTYTLPRTKVGYGVVATSTLAKAENVTPATTPDAFQRIVNEKYNANIMFLINQTNVRSSETTSDAVVALNNKLKEAQKADSLQVEGVKIDSYASPEGGVELNTRIAEGRENSTRAYLEKSLKDSKVKDFGELTANFTAQDWEGFQKLVSESNIQDKELILSVLSMYKDPQDREREIRNMSSVFDQLKQDVLPKLRYSRLTASINVIGKSDDQLKDAYANNPSSLSVDELLYTATLYNNDADKQAEIYAKTAEIYPNDYRAYNNLGKVQYIKGDYSSASANFDKAAQLAPDSKEVSMNQGLIALQKDDLDTARQKFGNAAGATDLPDALGTYYIKSGDVAQAANAFGDSKTNNAAIAQVLNKDYSKASSTLNSVENPTATTYYVKAIVAARTNNSQDVLSNLQKAVSMDSSLATRAKSDVEFSKYDLSSL